MTTNKLYQGIRQNNTPKVYVDNAELSFAAAYVLHPSEATPEWGYFGDGPSQTALAILYDATEDATNSLMYYHAFKNEFIASADYQLGFTILQSQVIDWLDKQIHNPNENSGGWFI